jgi:hypothetical protein
MPALTKEAFTGETHLKEQLETLRKYIYNVAQRNPQEHQEQRLVGIPYVMTTMGSLVDEIVKKRGAECDRLNSQYGDKP